MQFRVRRVDATDPGVAATLLHLQKTILPDDKPAAVSFGWWWIAFHGDEPAAFCGMYGSSQWCDAGYLCRAGVSPMYQGHGLQRRMIRVREREARKLGWVWLLSDTYENPPSANNLIGCGYQTYEPTIRWGADGVTYWKKAL